MKKIILIAALCFGASFVWSELKQWYRQQITRAYSSGYVEGRQEGILSCPCWEREGNICSLCQVELEGTGQFKRIK